MGLAGRDPIFYAQLDSELAYLRDRPADRQTVINTCFRCHGVMGKRQLDIDHGYDPVNPKPGTVEPDFDMDWIYSTNPADRGSNTGRWRVTASAARPVIAWPRPSRRPAGTRCNTFWSIRSPGSSRSAPPT